MPPPPERLLLAVALVAVLAAVPLAAPAGPADVGQSTAPADPQDALPSQVDADAVVMTVALQPDGDTAWTVEYRIRLDSENRTAAFETLEEDVAADPSNFTDRFRDRMRATAAAGENATGREMAISNVTVSAERKALPQEYGVVTYTFEWSGFAAVDGRRVVAGDALEGLFLDEETRMIVTWPADLALVGDPVPTPTETGRNRLVWEGPLDFGAGEPRVVVAEPGPLAGVRPLVLGGAVIAVLVGGGYLLWRRGLLSATGGDGDGTATAGEPDGGPAARGGDEEPPPELLSNEERVLRLVEQRGGRMKQQEIVDALDWTEAKTSQVVRDLREEGTLEGFRLGRENVLRLPEDDGSAAE